MNVHDDFDRQEAFQYRPGQKVEVRNKPGVFDVIAEYDPMMVPPIWLVNDPKPRYPEELKVVQQTVLRGWLSSVSRPTSSGRDRCEMPQVYRTPAKVKALPRI